MLQFLQGLHGNRIKCSVVLFQNYKRTFVSISADIHYIRLYWESSLLCLMLRSLRLLRNEII